MIKDTSYFDPRCDRYNHNSSDEESAVLDCCRPEIQNIQNLDFGSTSQKYNSSFRKFEPSDSPIQVSSPKPEPGSQTPTQKSALPDGRSSLDAVTSPNTGYMTNAAKEIMNHHEAKARLIRDSSCDSITDEGRVAKIQCSGYRIRDTVKYGTENLHYLFFLGIFL